MNEPLVSVVIPTFNRSRYLRQAIDSALAQDYARVETIVVDDGSSDDTPAVVAAYGARVRYERQRNAGQGAAINRGWACARGEILSYLGDDDILAPEAVRRSVLVLLSEPALAMTYGDYDLIDERSTRLRTVHAPEFDYERMLVDLVCAPGPGVFIRRPAAEAAGGWDEGLRQVPDLDYWLRLGLVGPFRRVPHVLASFRIHTGSLSFSMNTGRATEPLDVLRRVFDSGRLPEPLVVRRPRAMATAHLFAARAYMRAGCWRSAWGSIRSAGEPDPLLIITARGLRLLASGLVSRPYYKALSMRNRWMNG